MYKFLGKCHTCYKIDKGRRVSEDSKIQEAYKKLHALHRGGMFMLERHEYKKRCQEAYDDGFNQRRKVMSIIIDIMDQHAMAVPYLGSQDYFETPVHQIIIGAKEHGQRVHLFRTIGTAEKSKDLIVYVILSMLENFRANHPNNEYPEKFYVQVDGGSENANNTVLGILELLVAKRVCRVVLYTRLPKGHTHEVILVFIIIVFFVSFAF